MRGALRPGASCRTSSSRHAARTAALRGGCEDPWVEGESRYRVEGEPDWSRLQIDFGFRYGVLLAAQ